MYISISMPFSSCLFYINEFTDLISRFLLFYGKIDAIHVDDNLMGIGCFINNNSTIYICPFCWTPGEISGGVN